MSKQQDQLFLDVEDVLKIHKNRSETWCYERLRTIRKLNDLEPHQRVSTLQFCKYERVSKKEVMKALRAKPPGRD